MCLSLQLVCNCWMNVRVLFQSLAHFTSARMCIYPWALLTVIQTSDSVPNLILAFIPAEINPNTLNTMTAFAVSRSHGHFSEHMPMTLLDIQTGGLLSDVFLHLVPHSFMGTILLCLLFASTLRETQESTRTPAFTSYLWRRSAILLLGE